MKMRKLKTVKTPRKRPLRLSVISLGCPKTLVDTERALGFLKGLPVEIVDEVEGSDAVLINTCSFIESATQESIDTILSATRMKKEGKVGKVIVSGCLPQRYGDTIVQELSEVDAFLGTDGYQALPKTLIRVMKGERMVQIHQSRSLYNEVDGRVLLTPAHTAYLKIAEGCDKRCTFCAIPFIRGRQRSRTIESLVHEAEVLSGQGVRELVVVSQNTTNFGIDRGKLELAKLLRELCQVDGIRWIRFLYNYPSEFTEELIETVAGEERICKIVDLPLQHMHDRVLKKMLRSMARSGIERLLKRIRMIPEVGIRTQFIVGFPGEGDAEYQALLQFIRDWQFERLGLFTFSKEEGTPSARLTPEVSEEIKNQRFDEAMRVQQDIASRINARLHQKTLDVMIDERLESEPDLYLGRTQWDAPEVDGQVFVHSKAPLRPGDMTPVMITDTLEYDLVGTVVNPPLQAMKRKQPILKRALPSQ
jgi:ribosomal protein S12 methylthiotransferase